MNGVNVVVRSETGLKGVTGQTRLSSAVEVPEKSVRPLTAVEVPGRCVSTPLKEAVELT